jgi:TetR/AcrR family transcriptional regulator, biofilm operon repressor
LVFKVSVVCLHQFYKKMREKIIHKATELFFKLGFKSVTMDDIACEMCISKKTIYKFFANKEVLIQEGTNLIHNKIHDGIQQIIEENLNPIEENFVIRKMFADMFKIAETSPLFQLKKHYPEIYNSVVDREIKECSACFRQNIEKGIAQEYYRENLHIENYVKFYYTIIINVNENTISEKETQKLELEALEYHTRAMATPKGIIELEKQLLNYNMK